MLSAELAVAKENRRYSGRTQMRLAGTFAVDQSSRCLCRIADLSATGAKLELYNEIERGTDIELRLPHAVVRQARIVWVRNLEAGCVFDEPLPDAEYEALSQVYGLTDQTDDPFLSRKGRA